MDTRRMFLLPVVIFVATMAFNIGCKKTDTVTIIQAPEKQLVQVERMGIPTINTALMPADKKDAFNQGEPKNDIANFRSIAQSTITGLRAAVDPVLGAENGGPLGNLSPADVAGALIPDVVTINFASAVQFPNGRRLEDDVIDIALGVVLNRGLSAGVSDGINANDKTFLTTFPYLAADNVPLAKSGSN